MYVIGDIHGQLGKLTRLLRRAGLVGEDGRWAAGEAGLLFVGDFFDRGEDGIGVVDRVMRLQEEASDAGGRVHALLGNHEALILAAHRFGTPPFLRAWKQNGGRDADLTRLHDRHLAWLLALPAMERHGDGLYVHADAEFYRGYGGTSAEVNAGFREILAGDDPEAWYLLLDRFTQRHAFAAPGNPAPAARFLARYGGRQIVHGHTPIPLVTSRPAEAATAAYVYAAGLCVNVDGGMFLGGPGFVHETDDEPLPAPAP